jgi:hypothetical protein
VVDSKLVERRSATDHLAWIVHHQHVGFLGGASATDNFVDIFATIKDHVCTLVGGSIPNIVIGSWLCAVHQG